jgi:hypothetical protein
MGRNDFAAGNIHYKAFPFRVMAQIINLSASKSFNTSAIKNKYIGTLIVNYGTLASPCPATVKLRFLAGWEADLLQQTR